MDIILHALLSICINELKCGFITARLFAYLQLLKKVFYGQEPPSGESTTTESGVNYQLLAVMH